MRLLIGMLLVALPLHELWARGSWASQEAPTLVMLGAASWLLLVRRGVAFDAERGTLRAWWGLGFTRTRAWPLWQGRPVDFQFVAVRLQPSTHPKTPGAARGSRTAVVWMVDAGERWIPVEQAWTIEGAQRKAAAIARETGLPLQ